VAGDDRGAGQHLAQVRGARGLAVVGAQRDQVLGERAIGAEQRLDRQRGGDVGDAQQPPQVVVGEDQHAEHPVGAVDQRQALLGTERERLDAGLGERGALEHVALADQHHRAVGERREVAAGAERAVLGDPRRDPRVEQREHRLGHLRPRA
jgi:hypothetical protein